MSLFNPDDLGGSLYLILIRVLAVLTAMVLHEIAHGYVAYLCGDATAKADGRLSLNPLRHIDPFGALCLLLFRVGWAKPVPVNFGRLRKPLRDGTLVALAGVTLNFILFLLLTALSAWVGGLMFAPEALQYYGRAFFLRAGEEGYLLSLLPPRFFDYFGDALRLRWLMPVQAYLLTCAQINLGLCFFNLIPVPPLDGFHVLNNLLFKGRLLLNPRVLSVVHLAFFAALFLTDRVSSMLGLAMDAVQHGWIDLLLSLSDGVRV